MQGRSFLVIWLLLAHSEAKRSTENAQNTKRIHNWNQESGYRGMTAEQQAQQPPAQQNVQDVANSTRTELVNLPSGFQEQQNVGHIEMGGYHEINIAVGETWRIKGSIRLQDDTAHTAVKVVHTVGKILPWNWLQLNESVSSANESLNWSSSLVNKSVSSANESLTSNDRSTYPIPFHIDFYIREFTASKLRGTLSKGSTSREVSMPWTTADEYQWSHSGNGSPDHELCADGVCIQYIFVKKGSGDVLVKMGTDKGYLEVDQCCVKVQYINAGLKVVDFRIDRA